MLVSVAMLPTAANEKITDCRNASGYASGPAPDTCTVQLTLNDTDSKIINSFRAECQDFPLKCRHREYIIYIL